LIGLGTAAGFVLFAPAQAWALPPGCTQAGANFTCTAGIPAGQVLTGTSGDDIITATGGAGGNGGNGGIGFASGAGGAGATAASVAPGTPGPSPVAPATTPAPSPVSAASPAATASPASTTAASAPADQQRQ